MSLLDRYLDTEKYQGEIRPTKSFVLSEIW